MSDSVGKISLDLEVQSDLQGQLTKLSNNIGNSIKSSLNAGTNKIFENMNSGLKSSTKVLENNLVNSIGKMKSNLTSSFKAMFSSLKNVKMPSLDFGKPTNQATPKTTTTSSVNKTRGSPINAEILKTEIDNTAAALDVINRKIEQQQGKLLELKESYNTTFNQARKNKVEEQMLKTEASITKLIGQSDKLGFKLSDLDAKFSSLGTTSKATGNKIGLFNTISKNADTVSRKLSNSIKSVGNNVKKSNNNTKSFSNGIGMVAKQFLTWMVILPMIMKGLKAMTTGLYNNLMTNSQFANSLAQIKTNLSVAFTPIYNAILPAINSLMSALSKATQYIASFVSAIFGKTYQQSYQATQGLIDAKVAMGAYGDSAKKTAKDIKGALTGFDEINQLDLSENNEGDASGGGNDVPTLVTPALDTSTIDSSMKLLTDKIKGYFGTFDFSNLIKAFGKVKKAVLPIIDTIGQGLKWFLYNVLDPLAHWTISNLLPAFLDVLAGALTILNPILSIAGNAFKFLWDNFLAPVGSWTGGVIVSVLENLGAILTDIGTWIEEKLLPVNTDFFESLDKIAQKIEQALAPNIENVSEKFSELKEKLQPTIDKFGELFTKIVEGVSEVWENRLEPFINWCIDNILPKFIPIWETIANVILIIVGIIGGQLNGLITIIGGLIDFVTGVFSGNWQKAWSGVRDIFVGIFGGLAGLIKSPLNLVIEIVNSAIGSINTLIKKINTVNIKVPEILGGGTLGFNIPNIGKIPKLAKGGVLDQPTLAMIGEAGKEAVVPLENNTEWVDKIGSMVGTAVLQAMNFNGGSDNSSSGEFKLILDGQVCGRLLYPHIQKEKVRLGNTAITII